MIISFSINLNIIKLDGIDQIIECLSSRNEPEKLQEVAKKLLFLQKLVNQNITAKPIIQEGHKEPLQYILDQKPKITSSKVLEEKPVLSSKEIIANNLNSSLRNSSVLQISINK